MIDGKLFAVGKRETVRGTELEIVHFWHFDSVVYTVVCRDVCTVAESVCCIHHACLSACLPICPQVTAHFALHESTWNLCDGFHENVLTKSNLTKIGQKRTFTWRTQYVSLYLATLNSHKFYLEINLHQALRVSEVAQTLCERITFLHYTYIVCVSVCIWRETLTSICTYCCSQNTELYLHLLLFTKHRTLFAHPAVHKTQTSICNYCCSQNTDLYLHLLLFTNIDLYLHLLLFTKQATIHSSCLFKGRLLTEDFIYRWRWPVQDIRHCVMLGCSIWI